MNKVIVSLIAVLFFSGVIISAKRGNEYKLNKRETDSLTKVKLRLEIEINKVEIENLKRK